MFEGCYESWTIAGSARRRERFVGDIEHVVVPKFQDVRDEQDLFATPVRTNLLWRRLDSLLASRVDPGLSKHIYGALGFRWGDRYRGVDFCAFNNEIFLADSENFGSVLAIRTGPAEFSKSLVIGLLSQRRRNKDGYVWHCEKCPSSDKRCEKTCSHCQGTQLHPVEKIPVPSEADFFELANVRLVEPESRGVL